mgnify:CR=1 FL=1
MVVLLYVITVILGAATLFVTVYLSYSTCRKEGYSEIEKGRRRAYQKLKKIKKNEPLKKKESFEPPTIENLTSFVDITSNMTLAPPVPQPSTIDMLMAGSDNQRARTYQNQLEFLTPPDENASSLSLIPNKEDLQVFMRSLPSMNYSTPLSTLASAYRGELEIMNHEVPVSNSRMFYRKNDIF